MSRASLFARAATWAAFVLWTAWIWRTGSIREGVVGSGFLHMALLPFHEAGHVIFRLLGNFMMILGGSLGQLLMPLAAGYALLRRRDAFGAALCLWLLGFSVVDMAVYMYDASDPKLVLLGGETGAVAEPRHDWVNLFSDMGLLRRARGIGLFFGVVGHLAMLAGLAWAAVALWSQRRSRDASALADADLG